MPILYLLNYIELSYSEITFTYPTLDFRQFINSVDLEEVRERADLRIKVLCVNVISEELNST